MRKTFDKRFLFALVPVIAVLMLYGLFNAVFRPLSADKAERIMIWIRQSDGKYSETVISEKNTVKKIHSLLSDCENDMNIFNSHMFEYEKYQRDPQYFLRICYTGDICQDFCVHENNIAVSDRAKSGNAPSICIMSDGIDTGMITEFLAPENITE